MNAWAKHSLQPQFLKPGRPDGEKFHNLGTFLTVGNLFLNLGLIFTLQNASVQFDKIWVGLKFGRYGERGAKHLVAMFESDRHNFLDLIFTIAQTNT
jgi:hypothetical protein